MPSIGSSAAGGGGGLKGGSGGMGGLSAPKLIKPLGGGDDFVHPGSFLKNKLMSRRGEPALGSGPAINQDPANQADESADMTDPKVQAQMARAMALEKRQEQLKRKENAGRAMEQSGRAMEYSGKAVKNAGKGVDKTGQAIGKAGDALNKTRYGAIIGVPLKALGLGIRGAGKGTEKAGQATEKVGQKIKEQGKKIKEKAKEEEKGLKDLVKGKKSSASSKKILRAAFMALWIWFLFPLALLYIHANCFFYRIGFFRKIFGKLKLSQKIQFAIANVIAVVVVMLFLGVYFAYKHPFKTGIMLLDLAS
jgi:hypothetical protein